MPHGPDNCEDCGTLHMPASMQYDHDQTTTTTINVLTDEQYQAALDFPRRRPGVHLDEDGQAHLVGATVTFYPVGGEWEVDIHLPGEDGAVGFDVPRSAVAGEGRLAEWLLGPGDSNPPVIVSRDSIITPQGSIPIPPEETL